MRFIVGDGDTGDQEGGKEGQARQEEGREPGQEANRREERKEDGGGVEEGAAEEGVKQTRCPSWSPTSEFSLGLLCCHSPCNKTH